MPHDDCACNALRRAARRLSQVYDRALAGENLRTSQYAILAALAGRDDRSPTIAALAEALALDRTTLSHNLLPLERADLVRVEADGADKRVRRVRLTEAGRAKHAACRPLWHGAQAAFESRYGVARAKALVAELADITQGRDGAGPREGSSDAV